MIEYRFKHFHTLFITSKPRDAFIAFYPLYRLTLIQTELHEYVSKAQYTKVWTLR